MKIHPPAQALALMAKLRQSGYEAYLVGGCVRDSLLGRTVHDWDIATSARPAELLKLFAGFHCVTDGVKHGTVTVVVGGVPYEITAFRADGDYTDGRRPSAVAFGVPIEADLARRDFTVNAMAYDVESDRIIDPFGGRQDLHGGILRAVGDPLRRFREDALRMLRALRFVAELGFVIERETAEAMRESIALQNGLSRERVFAELSRLICGQAMVRVMLAFPDVIVQNVAPLRPGIGRYEGGAYEYDLYTRAVLAAQYVPCEVGVRFAALLRFQGGTAAQACLSGLRSSKALAERVGKLVDLQALSVVPTRVSVRRALLCIGEALWSDWLALRQAEAQARPIRDQEELRALAEIADIAAREIAQCLPLTLSALPVDGRDMASLGYRGAEIGAVLQRLLEAVADLSCAPEREALLTQAQAWRCGGV